MAIDSGFTVSRSGDKTIIHITPADEYSDGNLQIAKGFNLAGVGCIWIIAVIAGFVATAMAAFVLVEIDLFANNDTLAAIAMAAVFFPVSYLTFVIIRRMDRGKSGPPYVRQPETIVVSNKDVSFGERLIPIDDILSVDARHPPEYGGGTDTVVYDNDVQGRARASGYSSGVEYLRRCHAIYIRSAKMPQPVLAAFGLTMPSGRELAELILAEVRQRQS